MKNIRCWTFFGAGVLILAAACGDDEDSATVGPSGPSSTSAGGSSTSAGGSGGGTTSTSTSGPGGAGGTGSGGASACAGYCMDNIANCSGANAQWVGADPQGFCEAVCASYPPGTEGDMSGDTLACRVTHTDEAMDDPAGNCSAAGPYGGAVCGTTQCEVYCRILQTACTGANQQYPSETACLADCALLPDATTPYTGDADALGDNFACRGYHLTAAAVDPDTHCAHAGGQAQPCM